MGLRAVDFFCGTGGMTCGLRKAGIDVLAGIDNDPECSKTYEVNNPGSIFIEADIHNYPIEQLSADVGIEKNDDSLIFIGCSPCQFWSKINTVRNKSQQSKNLLKEFQQFVEYYRPGFIVIENVPGLYSKRNFNALSGFLDFLDTNGYAHDNKVINTVDYGVPQTRRRYLLLATRVTKKINLPQPQKNSSKLTVRNFIGDKNKFPALTAGSSDNSVLQHITAALSQKNLLRLKKTPKNGGNRMSWKDDPELQLGAYAGKDNIFTDVYGRMFWDRPAPTITTKFCSISNGRFAHPDENRGLSLREGATLQTFPRNYKFFGSSMSSVSRQIGNAVPPELAKRIGKQLLITHLESYAEPGR